MLDVEFTVSIIHCYLFNIFLLFCLAHLAIVPVQFRAHPLIVGAWESLNGRGKKGAKKNKEQGSSPRSLLFFAPFFFRLFRLFLALTICPWVSEDVSCHIY